MPVLIWSTIASLAGIITGMVYEKESDKKIIETKSEPSFSWWDKLLFAACGIAAYAIYKRAK